MSAALQFRLVPAPTFEAQVSLSVPGAAVPAVLRMVFRHKGRRDLTTWMSAAIQGGGGTDAEWLNQVVVGWSGVADPAGADVPYTLEALAALLDAYPAAGRQIYESYLEALTGERRKN